MRRPRILTKLAQVRRDGLAAGDADWPPLTWALIGGALWIYALWLSLPA